jgi:hypothetical protein
MYLRWAGLRLGTKERARMRCNGAVQRPVSGAQLRPVSEMMSRLNGNRGVLAPWLRNKQAARARAALAWPNTPRRPDRAVSSR